MDRKDTAAGFLFVAFGGFFALYAYAHLRFGTPSRMGPGLFPFVVGILLMLLGAVTVLRAVGRTSVPFGTVAWRGIILVGAAPIIFGATMTGLGFAPALALSLFVAAFASRRISLRSAVLLTGFLVVMSVLVFNVGLGLPLRLFGSWIGG